VLPLLLDETVAGAFYFAWWTDRKVFSERELELAENVAAQVTVVLRHARLFERAEREWQHLQVLYEISRALAAAEDADQILSLLVNQSTGLLEVEAAGIRLVEGDELVVRALTHSAAPLLSRPRVGLGEGLSGAVVSSGRPVVIPDLVEDARIDAADRQGAGQHGYHASLGVPLQIEGRVIGSLNVYTKSRRRFSPEDVSLLSVLGDHASLAIHKARLYEESRAQKEEATKLYGVTAHLATTLDVNSVLDQIVAKTVDLLGCDASGVYVLDGAREGLTFRRGLHLDPTLTRDLVLKPGEGVAGRAFDPFAGVRVFRGRGCPQCQGSGFRGRIGVFELFEVHEDVRRLIMERQDGGVIRTAAVESGMRTMFEDGLAKVLLGETTFEEVYRVAL
jgi:GAF domain-containing protein